jgi:LemA protein
MMANELDEMTGPVNPEGRDVHVIERPLKVSVGFGTKIFELLLWVLIVPAIILSFYSESIGGVAVVLAIWVLAFIPGVVFLFMKVQAKVYLDQLQQRINHNASQIDNYIEQRVQILQNAANIVSKSIDLDKDVMKSVAELRGGVQSNEENRNEIAGQVDSAMRSINVAFEAYPELRGHRALADAMQQNSYLQKEITAAREVYNDTVLKWNTDIFAWPTKMIVAARKGYSTRIPFTTSKETKAQARSTFF